MLRVCFAVGVVLFVAALSSPGVSPLFVGQLFLGSCAVLFGLARCSSALLLVARDLLAFIDEVDHE